ncbi:hypothetical protein GPECTOR_46g270 [Gonium pectorale]|uniref:RING-type domain-containing protein n=1 Tax=Gonium pectorale TaxID=33097 RepID=A0A150G8R2_GONPE|nr:hypothetical protein GPECTOR_46g270 [Gonium pectorale]|eukprot:KXZ46201.1 hypothetical protein GPECTOR_46g270 [Gonium pectorale]
MGTAISCALPGTSFELFQVWHYAASAGSVEVLTALMDAGRRRGALPRERLLRALNARNDRGQTPLMQAARAGNAGAVRWLLEQGADQWTVETNCLRTALHYAALRDRVECVEALLERLSTADLCRYLDVRTCSGMTALHYACVSNALGAVRCLLARGADMLATTTLGEAYDLVALPAGATPLHVAATTNALDCGLELLRHYHLHLASPFYPDPRRRLDGQSNTAYHVAMARRNMVLAEALHPASSLAALTGEEGPLGDAAQAAEGGDGSLLPRGVCAVPRLALLAGEGVRRQLLADIDLAEKVVAAFRNRNPDRFDPGAAGADQLPYLRITGSVADSAYARAPWLPVMQCSVCLEDEYCLVLETCHHRLCAGCARDVVTRTVRLPLPCPVCRLPVVQLTSPVC